ncbi:hypothetical protein PUN28_003276 [Cardiocondyla obscurior]|uniref:Uncharacterized protein n=1 Tax=Cardiocondyla obscurior TaxID=286306 RepID=A0AAW2GJZ9_9HYME
MPKDQLPLYLKRSRRFSISSVARKRTKSELLKRTIRNYSCDILSFFNKLIVIIIEKKTGIYIINKKKYIITRTTKKRA